MSLAIRYLHGGDSRVLPGQDVPVVPSRSLETGTHRLPVASGPEGPDRLSYWAGRVVVERAGRAPESYRIGERFTLSGGQRFRVVDA